MKLKIILLLVLLAAGSAYVQALKPTETLSHGGSAPHFGVSLKYNTDQERYEVYAQANFTRDRFILGPSQISIVVPNQVADQPLTIYSSTARWTDYSSVYAPSAAPSADFHGINSMGKVIDFQQDEPFLLFTFSLKGGYLDGVRLYDNITDPSSAHKSMMGGDFANTMQDHKNNDYFQSAFNQADVAQLTNAIPLEGTPTVSVYPNPITGDAFSVTAQQFEPGERLRLHLLSASGVVLLETEEETSKLVNYSVRVPKQLSGQAYLYAERMIVTPGRQTFCTKLIIVN